jgi:Na+/proline symporter
MSALLVKRAAIRGAFALITGTMVVVVVHLDWWRPEDVAIFLLAVGVSLLAGVIDLLEHRA